MPDRANTPECAACATDDIHTRAVWRVAAGHGCLDTVLCDRCRAALLERLEVAFKQAGARPAAGVLDAVWRLAGVERLPDA